MKNIQINIPFLNKVTAEDKAFFARQLSTMLDSGLSLDKALTVLIEQTKKPRFKTALENVLAQIEAGEPLSSAFKKDPEVFDAMFINIVISGEAVGKLSDVLKRLATTLEKQNSFMSKVKTAFYYPGFVIGVMVVIVYIMMTQVIPPLKDIFSEFGSELPWTTRNLLALSDFLVRYWWAFLIIIIIAGIVLYFYLNTDNGKYALGRLMIKAPLDIGKDVYMTRFCQTLSMLLQAGTPIIKSLNITANIMNNLVYRDAINLAADQMERGIPLSVPIEKDKNFNPLVPQMIRVGEETGKVDQTLERLSAYFEEQANTKLQNINSLIEPALIVIIGLGVAFIVFAIIMPIYQLVQIM